LEVRWDSLPALTISRLHVNHWSFHDQKASLRTLFIDGAKRESKINEKSILKRRLHCLNSGNRSEREHFLQESWSGEIA
jgi:hypothetical protein